MDVFEAIQTTRAMRRLDPDRPVSPEDLRAIVEAARFGPSGSNEQPTRWLVVTDAATRRALGAVYRRCWEEVAEPYYAKQPSSPTRERLLASAGYLGRHMGEAPAIIVPCAATIYEGMASSVYPSVQNLMLAARALGLGTTLTAVHRLGFEQEVRDVLGIPADVTTYALIPVGYPLGRWGQPSRLPFEEIAYWDRWGEPPAPTATPGR